MCRLNEHQARHIEATFASVETILQSIDKVARSDLSPFARERADLAPEEARLIQSFVALIRTRMLSALDRLRMPRPEQEISARWSASTSLTFADIALSGLTPSGLAGYGSVDSESAGVLEALAADLRALLKRARQALQEHEEAGLAKRAAAIAGESGSVLRAIEEVTRNRALAEVRPLLAAAIERAASTTFDVGVFGRVSAGKSSLINSLIGDRVLPVGATPVTAVPLRLTRGDAGAVLRLLDGERREIGIGEIAHYATEESNPENRLGIRSIEIRTPSVPPGLCLLDTPGVGSLNVSGPAAAFAWLPRCDLGLVLIAAGTAITHDDLALVTGLHHAGIRCAVLLSKSDLLEADEIERALDYVRRELRTTLGDDASSTMLEIHVVSTMPGNESSLDDFRMRALAPLGLDHARAARRALVSRLHRLADAVARALQAREEVAAKTGVESGGDLRGLRLRWRGQTSGQCFRIERAHGRWRRYVPRRTGFPGWHQRSSTPRLMRLCGHGRGSVMASRRLALR